jgi:N-acetylglucosamine-6-phosphate deacetylase
MTMAKQENGPAAVVYNGEVLTPRRRLRGGVFIRGGRIAALFEGAPPPGGAACGARLYDARGNYIIPGFIDMHLHGGSGVDFNRASAAGLAEAAQYHAAAGGTTALLPSLLTDSLPRLKEAAAVISRARRDCPGPEILGIHLEGPFLNPAFKGAHPAQHLLDPERRHLEALAGAAVGELVMLTLAPELPGGMEAVSFFARRGVVVALGHSGATYEQVREAAGRGLRHAVHTYSAMAGFHHRAPGALGAVLSLDGVSAELIADGAHTHPAAAKILFRAKGSDQVVLVTDASPAVGLGDGECLLGGRRVLIEKGQSFLPDGTLAGSTLTMNRAVAGAAEMASLPLEEALAAATVNPARVLGLSGRKGSLEQGKDADVVVMNRSFEVLLTLCRGREVFCRLGHTPDQEKTVPRR